MDRFPREHIRISESQVKRLAEGAAFHALRREGSAYDLIALEAGCTAASWQLGGSLTRAMLTASGIVLFEGSRRAPPRMVSYAEWKREAVAWTKCRAIPFFRQFRLRKSWLHWRRRAVFRRRAKQRRSLAESSIFSSGAAVRWLAKAHAAIAAATGEVPLELDLLPRCIDLALPAQKGPLDALGLDCSASRRPSRRQRLTCAYTRTQASFWRRRLIRGSSKFASARPARSPGQTARAQEGGGGAGACFAPRPCS